MRRSLPEVYRTALLWTRGCALSIRPSRYLRCAHEKSARKHDSTARLDAAGLPEYTMCMNQLIEINPRVCNGKPIIAGTRVPVSVIVDHLADGCAVDDIRAKFPELSREQVVAAIQHCHDLIERTELELA
ncbi:MAG: DUF433 domain-containing protein [Planctomycetota bacterium]|nr:DUF433 domain-containing protein [Planctomycetota bacterium]